MNWKWGGPMNNKGKCIYYVEGPCEQQLIAALKESPSKLLPGKVKVYNVIQNLIPKSQLLSIQAGTTVVLAFDTDVEQTVTLRKNLELLDKYCAKLHIVYLPQVLNLEDELVRFRRENVGFIFQSFHLIGTMNAVENVALPLNFRGEPRKQRMEKADRMLDLVNLSKHKKHMPNQMSGGQQQRVGVARALVTDPKIIFADEPTGNLDSHTSEEVMRLMQRVVREQGRTLVMVTHDDHLAEYADRVFHIIDGKIVKIEENQRKNEKSQEGGLK